MPSRFRPHSLALLRTPRLAFLAPAALAAGLLAGCGSMHHDSMGSGPMRSGSGASGAGSSQEMGASPSQTPMPGGVNSSDTNLERAYPPSKSGPPSTVRPGQ